MGSTSRRGARSPRGALLSVLLTAALGAAHGQAAGGPAPRSPAPGATADPSSDRLAWDALPGADAYRVRVAPLAFAATPERALAAPDAVLVESAATELPLAALPPLPPGAGGAWRVEARRGGEWSAGPASYFTVRFPGQTVGRAGAVSLLVHRVLVPPTLARPAQAWLGRVPLQPGQAVWPFDQPEARREITAPTWFGWIDDDPYAFFAHAGRFVLIDAASGAVEVLPVEWWPVVDGESVWMDDAAQADLEQLVYSERRPGGDAP